VLLNDYVDISRELFQLYQDIHDFGWEQLESIVTREDGPAIVQVRREASPSLPQADPASIDITAEFVESFRHAFEGVSMGVQKMTV